MTENEKKIKTIEENVDAISKTLYHINGTLMKEGELGATLAGIAVSLEKIATTLERCNWNFGTIATSLKKLADK